MTTQANPTIALTLRRQLGTALPMFGASNLLDTGRGLQFKIGRNSKRVTHITIELADDDTYTVKFSRVPTIKAMCKGAEVVTLAELAGVYVDSLHRVFESNTGLAASL
jgi:hypothetical protein